MMAEYEEQDEEFLYNWNETTDMSIYTDKV